MDRYQEILPSAALQDYIECYIVQEGEFSSRVKVVPGPGLVIGFQFSGRVSWQKDNKPLLLSTAGITGILNSYRLFEYTPGTGSVLIRFKPLAAAGFLPLPVHELQEQSLSLYEFLPASLLRQAEEQIGLAKDNPQRIEAIEKLLLQLLSSKRNDPLMTIVGRKIISAGGNIRVGWLAKSFCISQRQLERRFRATAGTSPRQFASIVRFQTVLQRAHRFTTLTSLAHDAGYADQSHFIREFAKLSGTTPLKYFSS